MYHRIAPLQKGHGADLYLPERSVGRRGRGRVPNLIRLLVLYDSILSILRISLALNFFCVPSSNKGALLCPHHSLLLPVISSFSLYFPLIFPTFHPLFPLFFPFSSFSSPFSLFLNFFPFFLLKAKLYIIFLVPIYLNGARDVLTSSPYTHVLEYSK